MSWRVIMVSSNAKVDYKMDYLVVRTIDSIRRVHMSEIAVLILESTAISITAYAMCELVKRKVKVIFCDHKRNPCAELMPLYGSHDTSDKVRQQIKWTSDAKACVWTEIVREKIRRQRDVLRLWEREEARLLTEYIGQLELNDVTNREGHSAKVYFNALFGMEFTRAATCHTNAALDYGYSLLLSAVNREIVAAGYLTQIGIFHANTYNPYNLSSDFMEPFRPLVDQTVMKMSPQKFEKEEKLTLVRLLNYEVVIEEKHQYFLSALRLYCASLFRALQSGDLGEIKLMAYEL